MNILHIISGGESGGSKNHLLSLSLDLKRRGIKSTILCFIKGKLYDEAKALGLNIILIKQPSRFDLSVVGKIKNICVREKIDIINCHGGRANFIAWFLRRKYDAKYVTTIHSDYKNDYKGNFYKTIVYSSINKLALKFFDGYITVSDNFKDMLIGRGFEEDRIFVIYNGIDFERARVKFIREEVLKKFNIKKHEHYITMLARLHPIKGHKVLLDACRLLAKDGIDFGLVLAGDGEIREELEEYVKKEHLYSNVYFVGFQRPDELIQLADFTVLTSYSESFPLVILESAFYEKTVVATDVGGISKLIRDGENGFLISPGDSSTLYKIMCELIRDSRMTEDFGKRLYETAKENYSVYNMSSGYIDAYEKLLLRDSKE